MIRTNKILERLVLKKAVIVTTQCQGDSYAAVPHGDRRCRPVAWISKTVISQWLADGSLVETNKNYAIEPSLAKRIKQARKYGASAAHGHQHRDMTSRTIFNPDGLRRHVQVNGFASVFQRLARQETADGKPFLQVDEIEAGERFAADYSKSMMGALATQNYGAVSGISTSGNSAENISISAVDAKQRTAKALAYVGPGLDRVLTALCGREYSLGQIEAEQGWSKSSGKTVLKLALSRLSVFYGCKAGAAPRSANQSACVSLNAGDHGVQSVGALRR